MDKPMVTIPLEEYYTLRKMADAYQSIEHAINIRDETCLIKSNVENLYHNLDLLTERVEKLEGRR